MKYAQKVSLMFRRGLNSFLFLGDFLQRVYVAYKVVSYRRNKFISQVFYQTIIAIRLCN